MSNENIDLAKIKDRIAKLLRMAADSSSPEEAAIAAGRARSMMDKYQIDAMDVSSLNEVFLSKNASMMLKNFPVWMQVLGVQVARYNDCQAVYEYGNHEVSGIGGAKAIQFRGYTSDVELAIEMYKRLCEAVDRLAVEYQKERGIEKYDPKIGAQFKSGAATAIIGNLGAMTVEREKIEHSTKGTALVAFKAKAVEAEFGKVNYSSVNTGDSVHSQHGYVRGAKVEIRKFVS